VINFANDLRQVDGFLPGTPVSSTNKNNRHDVAEILQKVALKINSLALTPVIGNMFYRWYQSSIPRRVLCEHPPH